MVEEGLVIKIEGTYAQVKVMRKPGCAHCPSFGICQTESDRFMVVRAENIARAKIGQKVKLFSPSGTILAASFLLYLVPLFGLLLGAMVGKLVIASFIPSISSEILAAVMGFMVMTGVYLGIRFYDRHYKKIKFIPKIIEII